MTQIELSRSTYERLLTHAISFDDTPNDVVGRLLDAVDQEDELGERVGRARKERAARGSILPEVEYWRPILSVLDEAGGVAPAADVIDAVGQRLKDKLTVQDEERLAMGEVRWRNRTRFARLRMIEKGLLGRKAGRGVWEITDDGRAYLQRLREVERSA